MLNRIWFGFFAMALVAGLYEAFVLHHPDVFQAIMESIFTMAKLSVEIAIGLMGLLCFWMGLFAIGEKAGLVNLLSKALAPLFKRLMPEVPSDHPALGAVTMNMAANILGLDNAATPMGLKAMKELQAINPHKDKASNAQVLFLVLNTSSVTLLPITILMYRAQMGAADASSVFLPIILATSASTFVGLVTVSIIQRIKLFDPVILFYFVGIAVLMGSFIALLASVPSAILAEGSSRVGNALLFGIVMLFLTAGMFRRINIYETFIQGAKQGFGISLKIIPYLVAMLVAIGVLRASGALDLLLALIRHGVDGLGWDNRFVDAMPTALMKPLSGSGSRAMMLETMNTHGVDSFAGRLSAIIQGSTETTFYVLAVYFGAVGIRHTRHAVACGLAADVAGIVTAVLVAYWFFG